MAYVIASGNIINVVGQDVPAATDPNSPQYSSGYGIGVGQLGLVFTGTGNLGESRLLGSNWLARIGAIQVVETDDRVVDGIAYFSAGEGRLAGARPQDKEFDIEVALSVDGETRSNFFHVNPTVDPGRLRDTAGADLTQPDSNFPADTTTVDFSFADSTSFDLTYNSGAVVRVTLKSAATTDIGQKVSILAQYEIIKNPTLIAYGGSSGPDTLNEANWNYLWNKFYMKGGNDTVIVPITDDHAIYFDGGAGNDYFLGSHQSDKALGNIGDDKINTSLGDDQLLGQVGNDVLNGAGGIDHLYGGVGKDILAGGSDSDYFVFKKGESNSSTSSADTISDWNGAEDFIDMPIAGTTANFARIAAPSGGLEAAKEYAEHTNLKFKTYVFSYDQRKDLGYLLADLDHNHVFETGVIIRGAGSPGDLHYNDII